MPKLNRILLIQKADIFLARDTDQKPTEGPVLLSCFVFQSRIVTFLHLDHAFKDGDDRAVNARCDWLQFLG
ncbi:hypothetical protein [Natronohydrobacter thiooxidans]|uniref:hypothetical protein n=1 Tax=Natronohydrobacter thiooxidans TaxID=87172 RepID=UPI0008FF1AC2|nr:hypothetical protein [Natronohydrobacter thiooxidans]